MGRELSTTWRNSYLTIRPFFLSIMSQMAKVMSSDAVTNRVLPLFTKHTAFTDFSCACNIRGETLPYIFHAQSSNTKAASSYFHSHNAGFNRFSTIFFLNTHSTQYPPPFFYFLGMCLIFKLPVLEISSGVFFLTFYTKHHCNSNQFQLWWQQCSGTVVVEYRVNYHIWQTMLAIGYAVKIPPLCSLKTALTWSV